MRLLVLILSLLLLFSCKSNTLPSSEVVALPPALDSLAIGDSIDLGYGFVYTRISQTRAIRQKPAAQPVYRKCKNCFNTDNTDKSKDKSKTKDNSDTTLKDKSDHSQLKKAEIDNSVNKGETKSAGLKEKALKLLLWLAVAVALFLLVRSELRKLFLVVLVVGTLGSCATSCPAYKPGERPMHKPTFFKDHGRQQYKYSEAAKRAADQNDKDLYLAALMLAK